MGSEITSQPDSNKPEDDVDSHDGNANGNLLHSDLLPHPTLSEVPSQFLDPVPDPPLEALERDPFSLAGGDLSSNANGMDINNMLGNLMSGSNNTTTTSGVVYQVRVYHYLWVCLAVFVRLLLGSSNSHLVGDNVVVPFLLAVTGLLITGATDLRGLQSASLITAVFVLCGVGANKVALLTRFLHGGRLLVMCFSIYIFSFIVTHLALDLMGQS